MGFFDRLSDFGERTQAKMIVKRIDIGLQQLEEEQSLPELKGLSSAVKIDIDNMFAITQKLSMESLLCLELEYKGYPVPYFTFLSVISKISENVIARGGQSLL